MLAEIIEEPEQIVEEAIEEVGDEVCGEICFDETPDDYDYESHKILHNAIKSIIPLDMFNSFAGFFNTKGTYIGMHREEEKKQPVEEITDVSKN
ncbi:hypothetical protein Hanom_Chr10g00916161 [Helianthus anomalus]